MPRRARIDYPGLIHHVMARTYRPHGLFLDDDDRQVFVSIFKKKILETNGRCYAWVLMDSHYHILIKTSELPLWKVMKPLNTEYARYYNKKYSVRGPLFSDRYKSIATQDQNYLEQLIRYVHLNPIRAGICKSLKSLEHYTWSGHIILLGKAKNQFQDVEAVLHRFGKTTLAARAGYLKYLEQGLNSSEANELVESIEKTNSGKTDRNCPAVWAIGDTAFQKTIMERDKENRLTIALYRKEQKTLEWLIKSISEKFEIKPSQLLMQSRRTSQADARKVFCHFACFFGFPTRKIGSFLGIQQAAVTNAAKKGSVIAEERGITIQ